MPVYASTPRFAERRAHPRTLTLIIGAHVVALAAVMTARMDLPTRIFDPPIVVTPIPIPADPPPQPLDDPRPAPRSAIVPVPRIVPLPLPDQPRVDPLPLPPGPLPGTGVDPQPQPQPQPLPDPVRIGPRFVTPAALVKPPYPESKRRLEQEASLRLRLAIDERGRVTSVEPVGKADPAFLEAARRHILVHWRYKPASEDGRAIATSTVVTLRFELDS